MPCSSSSRVCKSVRRAFTFHPHLPPAMNFTGLKESPESQCLFPVSVLSYWMNRSWRERLKWRQSHFYFKTAQGFLSAPCPSVWPVYRDVIAWRKEASEAAKTQAKFRGSDFAVWEQTTSVHSESITGDSTTLAGLGIALSIYIKPSGTVDVNVLFVHLRYRAKSNQISLYWPASVLTHQNPVLVG